MSEQVKHYAERDIMEMDHAGNYYCRHVSAMTAEGLHSKSDIAAELGFRDQRIDALHAEAEALRAENAKLRTELAEQGERQEAVAWTVAYPPEYKPFMHHLSFGSESEAARYAQQKTPKAMGCVVVALYTTPQPGPDVRALAAALYQACGAYDMPDRVLDALSAAANGEPFAHMVDGLLPCVPEYDVRALVEALEECAASLAWNCFGECRAIHAGPIMPAAMALDTARAALATYQQDT